MDNLTVAEIIVELSISRSYLYKVENDKKINIEKTDTGRYSGQK